MSLDFDNMIGKTLKSVTLDAARNHVTFAFADGFERSFGVEGDCCSNSWIEHLEAPADMSGATLLEVNDSAPVTQDHPEHDDNDGGFSEIQVYNVAFKTDRGDVILEFRNSSNGYYGGFLVDA